MTLVSFGVSFMCCVKKVFRNWNISSLKKQLAKAVQNTKLDGHQVLYETTLIPIR